MLAGFGVGSCTFPYSCISWLIRLCAPYFFVCASNDLWNVWSVKVLQETRICHLYLKNQKRLYLKNQKRAVQLWAPSGAFQKHSCFPGPIREHLPMCFLMDLLSWCVLFKDTEKTKLANLVTSSVSRREKNESAGECRDIALEFKGHKVQCECHKSQWGLLTWSWPWLSQPLESVLTPYHFRYGTCSLSNLQRQPSRET